MKRGHKKEHTIFGVVFLVLVVGFASFSQGGVVGHASIYGEDRPRHPNALPEDYGGEFFTYKEADIRSGNYDVGISTSPATSYFGELQGAKKPTLTMNYFLNPAAALFRGTYTESFLDTDNDEDFDTSDLRTIEICLLQALYSRNWVYPEEAPAIWRRNRLSACYGVEDMEYGLDFNEDGVLSRADYDYAKTEVYSGLVGTNRDRLSEYLECPKYRDGEITHISALGGLSECRNIVQEEGLPSDFYAWRLI